MIIPISNNILDNFQLKNQQFLVDANYYESLSGINEYRLYSYLSTFFNNTTILDIGTFNGRSAISLSHNENNKVISYDICNHINNMNHPIYTKSNIIFHIKDCLEDLTEELIKNVKLVVIDIDHYEVNELKIINRLKLLGFSGIIILDDIKHPDPAVYECMNRLWNNIQDTKYEVTKYAHWSGTGLIVINADITFDFS